MLLSKPRRAEEEFARYDCATLVKKFLLVTKSDLLIVPLGKGIADALDTPTTLPPWISEEEIEYFSSQFQRTGFTGGFNYYRAIDLNWELLAPWTGAKITVPTKYIVGDCDLVYNSPGTKDYVHKGGFKRAVPSLEEVIVIEGGHHFIQQEKPKEISDHILKFFGNFSALPTGNILESSIEGKGKLRSIDTCFPSRIVYLVPLLVLTHGK